MPYRAVVQRTVVVQVILGQPAVGHAGRSRSGHVRHPQVATLVLDAEVRGVGFVHDPVGYSPGRFARVGAAGQIGRTIRNSARVVFLGRVVIRPAGTGHRFGVEIGARLRQHQPATGLHSSQVGAGRVFPAARPGVVGELAHHAVFDHDQATRLARLQAGGFLHRRQSNGLPRLPATAAVRRRAQLVNNRGLGAADPQITAQRRVRQQDIPAELDLVRQRPIPHRRQIAGHGQQPPGRGEQQGHLVGQVVVHHRVGHRALEVEAAKRRKPLAIGQRVEPGQLAGVDQIQVAVPAEHDRRALFQLPEYPQRLLARIVFVQRGRTVLPGRRRVEGPDSQGVKLEMVELAAIRRVLGQFFALLATVQHVDRVGDEGVPLVVGGQRHHRRDDGVGIQELVSFQRRKPPHRLGYAEPGNGPETGDFFHARFFAVEIGLLGLVFIFTGAGVAPHQLGRIRAAVLDAMQRDDVAAGPLPMTEIVLLVFPQGHADHAAVAHRIEQVFRRENESGSSDASGHRERVGRGRLQVADEAVDGSQTGRSAFGIGAHQLPDVLDPVSDEIVVVLRLPVPWAVQHFGHAVIGDIGEPIGRRGRHAVHRPVVRQAGHGRRRRPLLIEIRHARNVDATALAERGLARQQGRQTQGDAARERSQPTFRARYRRDV